MSLGFDPEHVAIVLMQPNIPENIGAAARAMCNLGLRRLILVDPPRCDLTRVCKTATGPALDIVEEMEVFGRLEEALAEFHFVVGTTARRGGERAVVHTPEAVARMLLPIARENRVALLFGPEDRGLTNEDLRFCHVLATIPTAGFASFNLAQAVLIFCWELFQAEPREVQEFVPRLANRFELDAMYAQLKEVLLRICFLNPSNPDYFMNNLRQFGTRLRLRAKEVQIIRGICRQIDWYGKHCYEEGRRAGRREAGGGERGGEGEPG